MEKQRKQAKRRSKRTAKTHKAAEQEKPARVSPNRGKKFPAEILTGSEVKGLIRHCSSRCPSGIRNIALLSVMYGTGLRVSEALALYPKDVDADAHSIRVLHGKGNKARTVGIDDGTLAKLQRWIDHRKDLKINGRHTLFCTLAGKVLSADYMRQLLPRLAAKAGIEKRVHPHILRHTHASQLSAEGVSVGVISRQLGHSSIATTARYLDHISPQEVIDAIKKRNPWTREAG